MNKRRMRKLWMLPVFTLALVFVIGLCWKTNVFGKFIPQEPFVEGEPEIINNTLVTNEGSNLKGEDGSGAEPCCEEVPTCVGKKGSETNPFVILEVVADHAQQQMSYLAQEEDGEMPLDIMQIGIDDCTESRNFVNEKAIANYSFKDTLGNWFCKDEWKYEVYKIGEEDEKEELPFASIAKLYSFQITDDDIKNAGYSEEEFAKHYKQLKNNTMPAVKSFVEEHYPKLFEKDENGKEIRDIALEDDNNWYVDTVDRGDIQHNVTFTSDDLVRDNGYKHYVDKYEILQENPNVFSHDSSGNKISVSTRNDVDNWTGECTKTVSYDYTVVTPNIAEEDYNEYLNGKIQMKDLIGKYSNLFQEDKDGKAIEKSRLSVDGWELKKGEEEFPKTLNSGYVHYVGNGGKYSCELKWNPTRYELREKKGGEWEYLEKLPDGAKEANASDYWNGKFQNTEYYWSVSELKKAFQNSEVVKLEKRDIYTFTYKKDISHYKFSYKGKQKDYSFEYWGLRNNNILKRQLFQFKTQKECDDFHMKVVCMTPSELNEMAKKDTDQTLDMIERADMFYVAGYAGEGNDATAALEETYNLYYKYVRGKEDYKYDETKVASFFDDDLEWDLCYKLLFRLCHNKNLPLVITNTVGKLASESVANVRMYQSEQYPDVERGSILSNLGKLYIITTQFDLTAKRAEDETYVRTFYDDILDKLQRIPLAEAGKNASASSPIQYTGYYRRPKVVDSDDVVEREKCFYLWNNLTFFPEALGNLFYTGQQVSLSEENREQLKAYGYMPSYFDTADGSNMFSNASLAEQAPGSDGHMGNVGIPHNGSNGAYYSTLLGNAESSYVTNTIMNTAFLIMNNRPEVVNPQVVKLMKQKKEYVKMSDTDALVDHSSEQTYQEDEKSYIKVLLHNNNNGEAGVVTKVTLINEQGQPAPADSDLKLYTAKDYLEECGKAKYGIYEGYDIPDGESVIAYVPYSLKQWADGYNIVEFETVGRIYSEKRKTIIYGKPTKTNISINERTLFNLD